MCGYISDVRKRVREESLPATAAFKPPTGVEHGV